MSGRPLEPADHAVASAPAPAGAAPVPGLSTAPAKPTGPARAWQAIAVAAVGAIVLLALAWEWRLAPLRPGGSLLVLKALPLAFLLPGLVRGRLRSFQVGSMLILVYLAEGVVRGMSDPAPAATLAWIELALSTAAFGAILAHVRSRRPAPVRSRAAGAAR